MRFDTLLIANRGEIALRIIRSARKLGLKTVAVYSDVDAASAHVRDADIAVRIGTAEAARSYRNGQALVDACKRVGAQALHPGYGFLSENAEFAHAVVDAGLTFVGPSSKLIALMGNKAQAKLAMQRAGVPTVPGEQGCTTQEAALAAVQRIGLPVILKAAAGGGGRGMRIVRDVASLPAAFATARSEAASAFGSDELIIERAVEGGRHIEIQVLCDEHGHYLHLGERDCSTQRRFQKVIEEMPSPAVTPDLRRAMGEVATRACEAIGYTGVGTLEFLLDSQGRFYFMEMNTRLQVEHGVTEMVTGLDLVEQQLRVAQGEKLAFAQEEVRMHGHAIEVRLCAEDPAAGFLPQMGRVELWRPAPDIRIDSALHDGVEIGSAYDSMVAKLLVWGDTREQAARLMARACERTTLLGVRNNLGMLARILRHRQFLDGGVTTDFLAGEDMAAEVWKSCATDHARVAAGLLLSDAVRGDFLTTGATQARTSWLADATHALTSQGQFSNAIAVTVEPSEEAGAVVITFRARRTPQATQAGWQAGDDSVSLRISNLSWRPDPEITVKGRARRASTGTVGFAIDGVFRQLKCASSEANSWWVQDGADSFLFRRLMRFKADAELGAGGSLRAPMSGRLIAVMTSEGDVVEQGQTLAVMESMKMEMPLAAPQAGRVVRLAVREQMQLTAGQVLLEVEANDSANAGLQITHGNP